jgi:UDP-N-acetyl-alpha-D-muramoyl-L-alanyl-L-glutamate epimerase
MKDFVSFDSYSFLPDEDLIRFKYSFCDKQRYTHQLRVDLGPLREGKTSMAKLHKAVVAIGMAFMSPMLLSHVPQLAVCRCDALSAFEISFWETTYANCHAEYFFLNDISPKCHPTVSAEPSSNPPPPLPPSDQLPPPPSLASYADKKFLILMGGGKDSAVLRDMVHCANVPAGWLYFGADPREYEDCWRLRRFSHVREGVYGPTPCHVIWQDFLSHAECVKNQRHRAGDAQGFALMDCIVYVSLYALVAALTCLLHSYDAIVIGNEASANDANATHRGITVNHQYEKTSAFEALMRQYIARIIAPPTLYFSPLALFSEIEISARFAELTEFHPIFVSCNQPQRDRWCADCPKCAAIFALLSAVMHPHRVWAIFGDNLFEQPRLVETFDLIAGLNGCAARPKPLECVPSRSEIRISLRRAIVRYEAEGGELLPLPVYLAARKAELGRGDDAADVEDAYRFGDLKGGGVSQEEWGRMFWSGMGSAVNDLESVPA